MVPPVTMAYPPPSYIGGPSPVSPLLYDTLTGPKWGTVPLAEYKL